MAVGMSLADHRIDVDSHADLLSSTNLSSRVGISSSGMVRRGGGRLMGLPACLQLWNKKSWVGGDSVCMRAYIAS